MAESNDEFMAREMDALVEDDRDIEDADPEEIRAEIRETRERMGDTLEQLGERLNPGHLKEQVKQDIRDATIGKVEHMAQNAAGQMDEARHTITDTIRENPIPAAMVGVGLGWLIYSATQRGTERSFRATRRGEQARVGRYTGGYSSTGYSGTGYGTGYAGRMSQSSSAGESDTIDRGRERAGELADNVQDTASELAGRAQDVAENVADQTRYQARRVEDQFYETPLAVGAAALALGVAAGLAIPETRKESELMGGARDRLVHKVRDVAEETKDKVERVVDQAQSTAKEAARKEGLTTS